MKLLALAFVFALGGCITDPDDIGPDPGDPGAGPEVTDVDPLLPGAPITDGDPADAPGPPTCLQGSDATGCPR